MQILEMHDSCYVHSCTFLRRRYTFLDFVQSVFYSTTGLCLVCDPIAAINESHLFKLTASIAEESLMMPNEKRVVADAYILQKEPGSRRLAEKLVENFEAAEGEPDAAFKDSCHRNLDIEC